MNKVFKVIWNVATQSWVVVSELQKVKGKTKSIRLHTVAVGAALAGATLIGGQALAGVSIESTDNGAITLGSATGVDSIAIGGATNASGYNAVAIGVSAEASGESMEQDNNGRTIAIGSNSRATVYGAVAIGAFSIADNNSSNAIGISSNASGVNSFAMGTRAEASGESAYALGTDAIANNTKSIAIGSESKSSEDKTIAIGDRSNATGWHGISIGASATASGKSSMAFGDEANSTAEYAFSAGGLANATANYTTAIGANANATAEYASAIGKSATASGRMSTAIGVETFASGANGTAIGRMAEANGANALSMGFNATAGSASSNNAISIGSNSNATSGHSVTAIGNGAAASGNNAFAAGTTANASSANAVAIGYNANATLNGSVAIGYGSNVVATTPTNGAIVNNVTYSGFAGSTPSEGDVVSVGNASRKRQIQNVAAGQISQNSTDAINGSQLYLVAVEAARHSIVAAGQNISSVTTSTAGNGATIYTVNAIDTNTQASVTSKDKSVTISTSTNANGTTNYDLSVSKGTTTVVTNGTAVVNNSNVTDVATVGDIVNTINNVSWIVSGNGEEVEKITAGEVVNYIDGNNTKAVVKANATIGGADVTYNVEGDLTNITSIANGDTKISLGNNTVNVNNATITNVANGTNATDAVNLSQLNASKTYVKEGNHTNVTTTTNVDGSTNYIVNANHTVVENGTNVQLTSTTDGNGLTTYNVSVEGALSNITEISNDGNTVTIGNGTTVVNPNGTAAVANNSNVTDVATVGDIVNTINNVSWIVSGNGEEVEKITAGEVVNYIDGNNTKAVVKANATTGGADVTYNVEGDLTNITSIANGDTKISLGDNTVNVNNATITNVANGTNATDAVNLSQLNASKTYVKEGNHTNVTTTTNADGSTNYIVNANHTVVGNGTNVQLTSTTDGNGLTTYNVSVEGALSNITEISNDGNTVTIGNGTTVVNPNGTAAVANNSNITDVATVGDIVNTINNVSWIVSGNGEEVEKITAGEVVNYIDGNNTKAVVKANATTGGADVTYNVEGDLTNITSIANGDTKISLGDNTVNVNNATISNVASTLPDSTGKTSVTEGDISPVITETTKNNAATVGDVLNAGWNLQENGGAKDFVRPYDTVNFVDGTGTVASVTTDEAGKVSNVTFNADIAPIGNNEDGSVTGPTTGTQLVSAKDVVNAINNSGFDLNSSAVKGTNGVVTADSDTEAARVNPGSKVTVNAGRNIEISRSGSNINIATSDNPVFNSVQLGNSTGPVISSTKDGDVKIAKVDGSEARITNVAAGTARNDAVNVGQLKDEIGGVNNRINKVDKNLRAGIAGATATAGLYHATLPGKSMISAGAGTYKGESAVAIGYSRLSDNGKVGVKFSLHTNTRGDAGAAASVGYQW